MSARGRSKYDVRILKLVVGVLAYQTSFTMVMDSASVVLLLVLASV